MIENTFSGKEQKVQPPKTEIMTRDLSAVSSEALSNFDQIFDNMIKPVGKEAGAVSDFEVTILNGGKEAVRGIVAGTPNKKLAEMLRGCLKNPVETAKQTAEVGFWDRDISYGGVRDVM
jgi:hypothetical protein